MALLRAQYFNCKFYKRHPDSFEIDNEPILFKAELVNQRGSQRSLYMSNQLAKDYSFVIRTDSQDIYDFRAENGGEAIWGWVEFMGDYHLVESISFDFNHMGALKSGNMSRIRAEKNAIKEIILR